MPIKADGITERFLSDEPADLPDETEAEFVPAEDGDELDDAERASWTPPSGAPAISSTRASASTQRKRSPACEGETSRR